MAKILVMLKDPAGACRAWAQGPESKKEEVRKHAQDQLDRYREEKRELGDPLADAEYQEEIVLLEA